MSVARLSLPATLSVEVRTDATLTLMVSNPFADPIALSFASAQRAEFTISDVARTIVWRWSAERMFAQALGVHALAPNDVLRLTAEWLPTQRGTLIATAWLVSTSHVADAFVEFSLP